jgi:hypothetical protein
VSEQKQQKPPRKHGGGMPKGHKTRKTLARIAEQEALKELIKDSLRPMTEAQIRAAQGVCHLMLRDPKTGKFERVTEEKDIEKALASEGQAVWIYTKDPSTAAYTDLLNRTFGKPVDSLEANVKGGIQIVWKTEE